ncbi:2-dehydro-3-deoxy-6-phosphogalactonate aldolase [Caenimonas terrae]|uniref:2-dehydro-3-deoxy-6-phosphogalactonate aldolase n=1 Tax=Caenimonas terrae TaxID=696074 RepID=A0ABW0NBS1_9BURK
MNPQQKFTAAMAALPLVAILRGLRPVEAAGVGAALADAGFGLIEVPLNSPQPLQSIEALAAQHPQALVGAGTVLTVKDVDDVHGAGGQLVVAPNFDAAVVRQALRYGMVCLPGVLSATEAFAALAAGASGLKLFPAEMIPPPAVKALRAVLAPEVALLPVGGIGARNMGEYRAAGASGFGIGSALYKPGLDAQQVGANAREFAAAWAGTMRA